MIEQLPFLVWPFLGLLCIAAIHVYLGLHVVEREVIFVDLSLAQMAVLGAAITRPRMKGIQRTSVEREGGVSSLLHVRLRDALLRISLQVRVGIALAILFLMVMKAGYFSALFVMVIGVGGGLVASAVHRRPRGAAVLSQ